VGIGLTAASFAAAAVGDAPSAAEDVDEATVAGRWLLLGKRLRTLPRVGMSVVIGSGAVGQVVDDDVVVTAARVGIEGVQVGAARVERGQGRRCVVVATLRGRWVGLEAGCHGGGVRAVMQLGKVLLLRLVYVVLLLVLERPRMVLALLLLSLLIAVGLTLAE
jgi:hypothetical protein